MITRLFATAALAASLAACSTTAIKDAADVAEAALTTDETPETALPYVAMAGSSDMFEIQSSRLQLAQGQDARLRQFANMMIAHHTKTSQDLMAAARAAGLRPPAPRLVEFQAEMLSRLRPLRGADFDKEYRRQQVVSHQLALRLHENYSKAGDNAQLRAAAGATTGVVRQHLEMIGNIEVS